jgi:hypothetical protein
LFSETREAAVYWAIMKPEFGPPRFTRKAGRPLRNGLTSLSTLRSEMLVISETAMQSTSRAQATGWPWKFPPRIKSFVSGKNSGYAINNPPLPHPLLDEPSASRILCLACSASCTSAPFLATAARSSRLIPSALSTILFK